MKLVPMTSHCLKKTDDKPLFKNWMKTKVFKTSYDNPNFKITHFTLILALNPYWKYPEIVKITKKRDFEPRLLENEALNQKSWTLALWDAFGAVFSTFYFFRIGPPLKALGFWKSRIFNFGKSRLHVCTSKGGPNWLKTTFFQKIAKFRKMQFF